MRVKKIISILIPAFLLSMLLSVHGFASDSSPVTVKNTAELKAALEDPEGSNVRLGANIKFPKNTKMDYGVEIKGGKHVLDLNGFSIEYSYINSSREYTGSPICMQRGTLTINGNGAVKGGGIAIEIFGDSLLTINGGSYSGAAHSALRIQGVAILNGGSLEGRFGDVWLEGGVLVDDHKIVKKIDYTFKVPSAIIRNGAFSGNTELRVPFTLKDLNVPAGSSLTLTRNAVLNVTGTLTGEERIKIDEGLLVNSGNAVLKKKVSLNDDLTLEQLTIQENAQLVLVENTRLVVKGDLVNNGRVLAREGCALLVEGDATSSGEITCDEAGGFTVKGKLVNTGEINGAGAESYGSVSMPPRGGGPANTLYILGLFMGTGMDDQQRPIFDLDERPTRQVAITMLVRLLGKDAEALEGDWEHPFTDVSSWADPYVGYAYANGLTKGVSDTEFGSGTFADANQYLTFVLRALGYSDAAGDFRWNDPAVLTEKIGLTNSDEYRDSLAPFTRGDVAIISETVLQIHMKGSGTPLLQYLVNNNAVDFDDVIKAGLGHLLPPPEN